MRAVQLTAWQRPPELCEVAEPVAPAGGLVLEVLAAGLCHSDLHLMHWPEGSLPYELPFTLGHETVGTVVELGPGTTGVKRGETVIVYGPWGCGRCRSCSVGAETLCEDADRLGGRGAGLGFDGGLADRVAVPSARLTAPVDGLDPAAAAPLADAALTPYHAIRPILGALSPGSTAVVIGVGGLGHVAVQLLRRLTASRVIAVDRRAEALDLAVEAGADVVLEAGGLGGRALREAIGRGGAAFVMDCVGSDSTLALAAAAVGAGGHVAIVGMGGGTFPMRFGSVPFEATVTFPNWGTREELLEVVALARGGHIAIEVERVDLDDVVEAYARLERGEVNGRVVAVP
jgi:alcohol dehydrogenase, propanol-preferring